MRNGIGVLGLALPVVLIIGGGLHDVQPSLSAYYHFSAAHPTEYGGGTMRDTFVGMLFAIGAFLFFYRGHSLQEDIALNVAGISTVLVALLPMDWPPGSRSSATIPAYMHSVSATIFFIMIAYVCIFRARDTLCLMRSTGRRRIFKRLYLFLGLLMLATPAAVSALDIVAPGRNGYSTLVVEVGGVLVFSAFWLIKSVEIRSSLQPGFASSSERAASTTAIGLRRECGMRTGAEPHPFPGGYDALSIVTE